MLIKKRKVIIKDYLRKNLSFILIGGILEFVFSLFIWFKTGEKDPKILDDISAIIIMFLIHEILLLSVLFLKTQKIRDFKLNRLGFYAGLIILFIIHLGAWDVTSEGSDELMFFYLSAPIVFAFSTALLITIVYNVGKIIVKVISKLKI